MKNLPVHWYQGLFIRPHHLQAADRYWAELQFTSLRWDRPYCYGLHAIRHNEDSLRNCELRITRLEARMRDGTLIGLDEGEVLDIDLKPVLTDEPITVYVGVPKLNPGGENVGVFGANGVTRYHRVRHSVKDETGWSDPQDVEFRRVRMQLLTDRRDGFETLELGRIRRVGSRSDHPEMEQSYIPPLLSVDAWPLLQERLNRVLANVKARMDDKADILRQLPIDRIDRNDVPHFMLLDRYNECFTMLDLLLPAQGIHPFDAYRELARVLARLSLLSAGRRAIDVMPYDHDNLGPIFVDICDKILRNLDPLVQRYLFQKFVGDGTAMMVTLGALWFEPQWQWYLGVDRGSQFTDEELDQFLERSGEWSWVFGSRDRVDEYFAVRFQGLKRRLVTTTIPELPSRDTWTFYNLPR